MMKELFTGRLALVTGAGRGNGAAIARGVFLCSDAASYVTGAILAVNGGFLAV